MESQTDILVVGGGTGGVAAALGGVATGRRVILTEETDWVGGQLTSQAVPPDEHRWIESFGCTARYRRFRNLVRAYYREHYPLLPAARANPHLNPGQATVSRLCGEPRVAVAALEQMLAPAVASGQLQVRHWRRPVAASADGDRLESVTFRHLRTGDEEAVRAAYILDATELGDLLALGGAEYVSGAESQDDTDEPHAVSGPPQPDNVQALTWCFAMAWDPEGHRVIDRPAAYERWRDYVPPLRPAWSGRMLSWTYTHPITLEPMERVLFPWEDEDPHRGLWTYRRLICRDHYAEGQMPHEVTLVNWPQTDYVEGNIIDRPDNEVEAHLDRAREQALCFFYWMQTEAPRPDGGTGYPGLYLRPDITGTDDGFAKYPYIREARRLQSAFVVTENHVGREARGQDGAAPFGDSVGVGSYRIDLHPSTGGDNYIDISSLPFQIPLGSLVPVRVENLLAAGKSLGVTHISNGCYRLHPVEWNVGEAAGLLAGFCLAGGHTPLEVYGSATLTEAFQRLLLDQGVELEWPAICPA